MASLPLKVIALISGGKDSLFSILHCLANGHELVALANLYPQISPGGQQHDDIDSFMYQTVGHGVIPLYAGALGIPLFREEISGSAVDTGREYGLGENGDDETEDLVPLLERCLRETGANAVSTGAILSTYQRTRVEAVAVRLGLTPLSYLWQHLYLPPYTQTSLLDDMRHVGQEARIIKVASGGLDESFLWQDVAAQKTIAKMKRRMDMFGGEDGGAIIGEGGEFETLALDGPAPLWKQRIEILEVTNITGEGGSASTQLKGARLASKAAVNVDGEPQLRVPPLLDTEFEQVLNQLRNLSPWEDNQHGRGAETPISCSAAAIVDRKVVEDISGLNSSNIRIMNMMASRTDTTGEPMTANIKDQMTDLTHQISHALLQLQLGVSDVIHTTIRLRDMSFFAEVNAVYGSYFCLPNPPSRVTISCGELMPKDVDIMLGMEVGRGSHEGEREVLHVQSRSYWAPANIGPYSQAVSVPLISRLFQDDSMATTARLVHVAGQIPLKPASMQVVTASDLEVSGAMLVSACASCESTDHLERCTTCKSIKYCSKECQKRDRKAHKEVCALLVERRATKEEDPPFSTSKFNMDSASRLEIDEFVSLPFQLSEFVAQSVLSLQHLWRIGRVTNVKAWTGAVAFISRCTAPESAKKAHLACETWYRVHEVLRNIADATKDGESEEPDERDAWDIKNGVARLQISGDEKDIRLRLPDFSKIRMDKTSSTMLHPPVFAAQVQSLPRDVQIEWCSVGIVVTGQQIEYTTGQGEAGSVFYNCTVQTSQRTKTVVTYLAFDKADDMDEYLQTVADKSRYESTTVYTATALPEAFWRMFPKAMLIPCFGLWSRDEKEGLRAIEVLLTMKCEEGV